MSRPHRVLVVDDEEGILLALEDILQMEGYDVMLASNGREALEVMATWNPDLILLDLMMPVMNGRAFREAQVDLPDGKDEIPVVVLSGTRDAAARAAALGAVAVLRKPFDLDDILAIVARVIVNHAR